MSENFQQTVNLREKIKQNRGERINNIYKDERGSKKDWQKIHRPNEVRLNEKLIKRIVMLAAVFLIVFSVYWLFFHDKKNVENSASLKWYAVKLVDGTEWFGQIGDTAADPVKIQNIYYNYDQADSGGVDSGSLRLVKRGKETHGPTGSADIVRTQILYMEPLAQDSKVLKAILEYER